jgi:hypothetical protein
MTSVPVWELLSGNRTPAFPLTVPRGSLNRNTFGCGATGAGKSQAIRHLLVSKKRP